MSSRRVLAEIVDWVDVRSQVDFAVTAERLGFSGVTLAEVASPDAFVVLGLAAAATSTVTLETAIVQCGVRTIPSMAASAATVQEISDGRFRLGIGVSSEAIVSGWHGRDWQKPVTHAKESLELLRLVLDGEKTSYEGRALRSHGFRLVPPRVGVPVHLAALNQGMLSLAGGRADGVWLNYLPRHAAPKVSALVDNAARAEGRAAPRKLLTCITDVTDDPASSREQIRDFLAFYMASPAYRRALAWHGFEAEMGDAEVRFEARDRDGVKRCVTDELIDAITMVGSATVVRDRIEEYFAGGIDELAVAVLNPANLDASLAAAVAAQGG